MTFSAPRTSSSRANAVAPHQAVGWLEASAWHAVFLM